MTLLTESLRCRDVELPLGTTAVTGNVEHISPWRDRDRLGA
ncbi:MAG: hypothetical protein ACFBSF_02400 [Leptolyngbyaceae cyanobacterium]